MKTGRPIWNSPHFLNSLESWLLVLLLVLFFASFLAASLASQRFFDSLPLARLKIERVTFYFFDYVLSLYLPLEPSQCVFEGFTLLQSYFRQRDYTPPLVLSGLVSYGKHYPVKSSRMCRNLHLTSKIETH